MSEAKRQKIGGWLAPKSQIAASMALRGTSSESSSTFIEDYVEMLATLPNEVRRHFDLMRALDKEGAEHLKDLEDCERRYLADLKKRGRQVIE